MTPEEIHEAFISTNFIILKNDIFIDSVILKIGEIHIFPANIRSWAYITAWNPLPTILNYGENVSRNNNLLYDLTNRGYKCHLGKGVSADGEWEEESFFIENINKTTALEFAIKYGQKAFVYGEVNKKAKLIYTTSI